MRLRTEVVVEKPLMSIDRQMGLVIVTPEGKVRETRLTAPVLSQM